MALYDDAARDIQAQASALANLLCCKEGLERPGGYLRRDARPGIADLDHYGVLIKSRDDP